jgi:hypothetical protein
VPFQSTVLHNKNRMEVQSLRQILNSCKMWHILSLLLIPLHNHIQFCSSQCCHYNTMHMAKNFVPVFPSLKGKERKGKERKGKKEKLRTRIFYFLSQYFCVMYDLHYYISASTYDTVTMPRMWFVFLNL